MMKMDDQIKNIYRLIQEKKIGYSDALKMIEEYKAKIDRNSQTPELSEALLREKAEDYFKKLLSSEIKFPAHRIKSDDPMEKYGIDSVMVMKLTGVLERVFGTLPKTLFFEFKNIRELTEYFMTSHRDKLIEQISDKDAAVNTGSQIGQAVELNRSSKQVINIRSRLQASSPVTGSRKKETSHALDIAIIGVAGRYPQADNLNEFWKNLRDGKDCITEIPKDRWDHSLYFHEDRNFHGKTYSKWGGFLRNVDCFDPRFFNISPREAEMMDPQERLFLECVYETLEDAGYTRKALENYNHLGLEGNVGVFVGVMYEEYQLYGAQQTILGKPTALPGNPSSIANRVSYFCNFHGPSMAIDTMCSSSLTAIHLACQSLKLGDCELAVAGGVNVSIHPNKYLALAQGRFVSSKGRCESFGQGGDGYVPGEGVGAVLLKPLSRAEADGDHIYAVIKSTAVNHGGKTNGYSVPNPKAQANVIGQAIKRSGVNPRTISYIEAHGTGTSLGDPIEITGISKAFEEYTDEKLFCAIGSVKSNIGHCESAAGIAGITKILLQLKYRQLVPSLHSRVLNPNIDFSRTPFKVQQELTEWKRPVIEIQGRTEEYPRRAGISAFGAGGSNAHIIIEEYTGHMQECNTESTVPEGPVIIVLSAKNGERLKERVGRLLEAAGEKCFSDRDLKDVAYTLQTGREHMEERLALTVKSVEELGEKLRCFLEGQEGVEGLYYGQAKGNKETLDVLTEDEDMEKTVEAWVHKKKYSKILELWVKGLVFDWNRLYGETKPRRFSLPAYPFARERYWAPKMDLSSGSVVNSGNIPRALPVLHEDKRADTLSVSNREIDGIKHIEGKVQLLSVQSAALQDRDQNTQFEAQEKPKAITLQPLSGGGITAGEPAGQALQGIIPEPDCGYEHQNTENTGIQTVNSGQTFYTGEMLQEELRQSLAQALYMDPQEVDVNTKFIDMGLDSIIGVEWIQAVNKKYGVSVPVTKVYDYPTIHEFSLFLGKELNSHGKTVPVNPALPASGNTPQITLQNPSVPTSTSLMKDSGKMEQPASSNTGWLEALQEELKVSLAQALFMDPVEVDIDTKFIDLGLDSIIGVEWIQSINKRFGCSIQATKVYDYPTLREISKYLAKELELNNGGRIPGAELNLSHSGTLGTEEEFAPEKKPEAADTVMEAAAASVEQEVLADLMKDKKVQLTPKANEPEQLLKSSKLKPEELGNPVFRERYRCRLNYFSGSMYRGIASEKLVITMAESKLLSFFGSAGFGPVELEEYIKRIQSQISQSSPYGMCLICNLNDPDEELKQVELYIRYNIPVIEAAAYSSLTVPLVYLRVKGLTQQGDKIVFPRRIIAKCSRLEVAQLFLSPPHKSMVDYLLEKGMINEEEARLSQFIPMADDLAIEGDSGGHTDQGVSFSLIPSVTTLKEKMKRQYNYREEIMVGCGGGIGTPEAAAAAFMLGADFIFTGSINQCTVESGAHDTVKDLLSSVSIHDTTVTVSGDMFEIGAKIQVVKKNTKFPVRANRLYQLFNQYNSIDEIPEAARREIENNYFKRSISEVWEQVCEYKSRKNPAQIIEARENPRLKTALIFKWYFAHCSNVTLNGDETEKDNFLIYCGPAMGAFNQWVRGTEYESWKNRHVDEIAFMLMSKACESIELKQIYKSHTSSIELVHEEKTATKPELKEDNIHLGIENEPIAVIGMSGQFPKARNLQEFWNNLINGEDCISEVPSHRWSLEKYYHPDPKVPGKTYSKWMGCLEDIDKFDPLFFNISPVEAELMDPQQRLFLENCWHCIEDAGISPSSLSGSKCSVFVGCSPGDYGQSASDNELNAQGLMGGATSILSARISYLLNLKGPSIAIETACSSSLVAIAEACNSLVLRMSDLALAGGVCVLTGPSMHIMTSKSGMLSKDGRCFAFDSKANGFVPGEGVGVVLLKRLSDAVRDNDTIYGVIRGWGINQDGKTNGITAPSVNSQIQLEKEVYQRFNINPETITMVEAHGTGTKLGDPIEVEALTEAFRSFTDKKGYCALGSVKSNIGHLLTAAGVAGVIKVLLALKHGMIPPLVNFESLNEHIPLENSPFYINKKASRWNVEDGVPRRACVSAFGFSGTNAHIVIEEYIPMTGEIRDTAATEGKPVLMVLSAKNEERLKAYAENIINYVDTNPELDLKSMAYTLQVGREPMDYRLAFRTESREQLLDVLRGYINGRLVNVAFNGCIKRTKSEAAALENNPEKEKILGNLIKVGDIDKIAEMWVKGVTIDWGLLYGTSKPGKISIPNYPFVRESYWLSSGKDHLTGVEKEVRAVQIHPLLHENVSDLAEVKYRTTFNGNEFFLQNHIVMGQPILPGVAYMEMARAAVESAGNAIKNGNRVLQLKNVVWAAPVIVKNQPVQVNIALYKEDNGEIGYEIYSHSQEEGDTVHCSGSACFIPDTENYETDINELLSQCSSNIISAADCYEAFRSMGIEYGSGHQGVETIYTGKNFVLARISLPDSVKGTMDQYYLHPSIMDSALQAAIGLISEITDHGYEDMEPQKPFLPFAVEKAEVISGCTEKMWSLIRLNGDRSTKNKVQKMDMDLIDDTGKVCVRIKGFSTRQLEDSNKLQGIIDPAEDKISETMLLAPVWDTVTVEENKAAAQNYEEKVLIIGGTPECRKALTDFYHKSALLELEEQDTVEVIAEKLNRLGIVDHIIWIAPQCASNSLTDDAVIEGQNQGVLQLFRIIKALLRLGYRNRNLRFCIITVKVQPVKKNDKVNATHASVHGFTGSLAKEYPNWRISLADLESYDNWPVRSLFSLPPDPKGNAWVHRGNEWYRQQLVAYECSVLNRTSYRMGGVYVVIGGAGGIGEAWSEYMIRTYKAHIVWIGRRQMDEKIQEKLNRLSGFGPAPVYITADASDRTALTMALSEIKRLYTQIHGVIHSAIVLLDQSIANMEEERFKAGLAAKVNISVRIAQVFQNEALDFVLFFSSMISFTKHAGQSNYASGCTFKDAYARQLGMEWSCPVKIMNWGYWGSLGIVASKYYHDKMREAGIDSIEPPEAMEALEKLLAGPLDQAAMLKVMDWAEIDEINPHESIVYCPEYES
jgi:PfaD family protein